MILGMSYGRLPLFKVGQHVRVVLNERNTTPHAGIVGEVKWHHKAERYYYYIEEDGKRVSKRYFDADLERVTTGP